MNIYLPVQTSHLWELLTSREKANAPRANSIQASQAQLHTATKAKLSVDGYSTCDWAIIIS